MKINGNLELFDENSLILNTRIENLGSDPVTAVAAGRIYFNTTDSSFKFYDGSQWVAFATGGNAAALQIELDAVEASLGSFVNADGTYNAATLDALSTVTGSTSLSDALAQMDTAISNAAGVDTLAELTDVIIVPTSQDFLMYNGSVWADHVLVTADLSDTTVSAAELNFVTGVTSSIQTQLNTVSNAATAVQTEVDTIETALGVVGPTGTYVSFSGTNYIDGGSTLLGDITDLDTAVAGVQTALDNKTYVLDDNTDVTITAAAGGDVLMHNGTAWVDTDSATARTSLDVYSKTEADTAFVDVAGDAMTGTLNMGGNLVSGLANPIVSTDAANKGYVDANLAGLSWKDPAAAATDGSDITLSGTQTIDGVVLVAGQRVLVKDQTLPAENGIYVVDGGAWTRATDMDSSSPIDEFTSAAVLVSAGTTNENIAFTVTSSVTTVGTDPVTFAPFTGATAINAGVGLGQSGNTIFVNMGAGVVQLPSDEVGIDVHTGGGLATSLTVGGVSDTSTNAQLGIKLDSATLALSASGLKVNSNGITQTEITSAAFGDGIAGGSGALIALDLVALSGLVITGGELDLDAIPNAALTNSSVTVAGDSGAPDEVSLGQTLTFTGGTGIDTTIGNNIITLDLNAALSLLTDVDTTGAVDGSALVFNNTSGNWEAGNPVNSTSELTDVTGAASASGQILVSDGTDYTPKAIHHVYTGAAAAAHVVTHNLGQQYCNVTVVDSTDQVVIPQSITMDSATQLTVVFNSALACKVIVSGVA